MRRMDAPVQRRRHGRASRECRQCGVTFETVQSQINNGNGKFCSRECWNAARMERAQAPQEGRTCCRCKQYKSAEAFGRNPQRPTRLRANCTACRREMEKERRARNPERATRLRLAILLKQYGMTIEDYQARLLAQGGACLICTRTPSADGHVRLVVDHDHATGRVRGLLCNNCNSGLGYFRDDPNALASAIRYLARQSASS